MFEWVHWTEYLKAIGPTLIAIFVVYIAYQQWQINRANLRERLFDRRFAVFKSAQSFLYAIQTDAKLEDLALGEYHETPQIARFLFDKKMSLYLYSLRRRAIKMRAHARAAAHPKSEEERLQSVENENLELEWLNNQLEEIYEHFHPYLAFEKHK